MQHTTLDTSSSRKNVYISDISGFYRRNVFYAQLFIAELIAHFSWNRAGTFPEIRSYFRDPKSKNRTLIKDV